MVATPKVSDFAAVGEGVAACWARAMGAARAAARSRSVLRLGIVATILSITTAYRAPIWRSEKLSKGLTCKTCAA